jgi:fluoride ion exporter CrcB/FEX
VLSFTTIVSFSIRYPFMEDSSRTISDLLSPVANLLFGLVLLFSANWIVRAMKWD